MGRRGILTIVQELFTNYVWTASRKVPSRAVSCFSVVNGGVPAQTPSNVGSINHPTMVPNTVTTTTPTKKTMRTANEKDAIVDVLGFEGCLAQQLWAGVKTCTTHKFVSV